MWPRGGLSIYCTRLTNTGSVSLICRTGLSNTWDENTLNWSNAPLPKTTGGPAFTINWNKTNFFTQSGMTPTPPLTEDGATGKWFVLNYLPDIKDAIANSATSLTAIVMAPGEQSSNNVAPNSTTGGGWAYFAKAATAKPHLLPTHPVAGAAPLAARVAIPHHPTEKPT